MWLCLVIRPPGEKKKVKILVEAIVSYIFISFYFQRL